MSNFAIGLIAYAVLQGFWVLGAIVAWGCNMLTVAQMHRFNVFKGMPYFAHEGMWNDAVLIDALIALFIGMYWRQWIGQWWLAPIALIALVISVKANIWWAQRSVDIIQSHAEIAADKLHSTGRMSYVGWGHIPPMAIIVAAIGMMLISAGLGDMPWQLVAGATCMLLGHLAVMQHPILRVWNPTWNPLPAMEYQNSFTGAFVVLTVLGLTLILNYFSSN